jgi:ATP-dependent DNA helicase RecQ
MLLSYFGEREAEACGICDLCITANSRSEERLLRDRILEQLKIRPMRSDELMGTLSERDEENVKKVLRELVDEGAVSVNEALEFTI